MLVVKLEKLDKLDELLKKIDNMKVSNEKEWTRKRMNKSLH